MRIKKVELNGFKSFARKTVLEFSGGISGIVGPNGCGKSNIVDAIRWTLGEQSARLLRGKSMEDVIFSGTGMVKPLGMSRIVITFDVDGAELPSPYGGLSELEVERRLFRTGASEYFINRAPCRLKDITSIFMDTGAGKRAYSIIEQGRVNDIIGAKPEDMRLFIEEAAGIGRYRLKREETLKKIDSANANLQRLNDVMAEMKRQLNSLHRQMKKAERFRRIKGELRDLERAILLHEYETLVMERESVDVEYRRFCAIKNRMEEDLNHCRKERELFEERLSSCEGKAGSLRKGISNLLDRMKMMDQAEQDSRLKHDRLLSSIGHLEREIPNLTAEEERLSSKLEEADRSREEVALMRKGEEERLHEVEQGLLSLKERMKISESEMADIKEKNFRLLLEISRKRNEERDSAKKREELSLSMKRVFARLSSLIDRIGAKEAEMAALNSSLQEKRGAAKSLSASLERVEGRLKGLEGDISKSEEELLMKRKEYLLTSSKLKSLMELERSGEGLKGGTRALLESRDLRGSITGVLSDYIEVDPGLEDAISSFLGEAIEYLLVKDTESVLSGLEILKKKEAGRAGFVPGDLIRPLDTAEGGVNIRGRGILGEAVKFVKAPPPADLPLKRLLHGVLIVKDLPTALRVMERGEWKGAVLTCDGEILHPSGIICGGKGASTANPLKRKREIRELEKEVAGLAGELALLEEKSGDLRIQRDKNRSEVERMRGDHRNLAFEISNHEKRLENSGAELLALKDEEKVEAAEIERMEEESEGLEKLERGLREETISLEREAGRLQERLADFESSLKTSETGLDEASRQITSCRERIALLGERENSLKRELSEVVHALERVRGDIKGKREEMEAGRKGLEKSGDVMKRLEEERQRVEKEHRRLSRAIQKEEENLEIVRGEVERLRKEERRLDRDYSSTRDSLQEIEIKRSRMELKISNLCQNARERINEDLLRSYHDGIVKGTTFRKGGEEVEEINRSMGELRSKLEGLGEVNLAAISEYNELNERYDFMDGQREDLVNSIRSLRATISKINRESEKRFKETFDEVNRIFEGVFPKLFTGGHGRLHLVDPDNLLETGVYVMAQPPGKRLQNMNLLSGGEKAMAAIALIFSLFIVKPSPFCILDEVEAALDDVNIDRFNYLIKEISKRAQIIIITHNKRTMEVMDNLYGITMEEPGISKVISVRLSGPEAIS